MKWRSNSTSRQSGLRAVGWRNARPAVPLGDQFIGKE